MNWTNIMSSKGQVYAIYIYDFISKTEASVYFEQVGIAHLKYWASGMRWILLVLLLS